MTPYTFSLSVFRLVAVGLLVHLLYSWAAFRLIPLPNLGPGIDVSQAMEGPKQILVRQSELSLGTAAFLYLLSPVLARLVAIGQ
jgi:hypothetical protein